ncbi:TetR/AcrR family transcriptional regulator [Amycolatopsis sp. CA-230715]|uniref:TetR/AcrR family transcriptional regulator n=1 Tax=Amycolatopsis sp. CA-230715 TaxID=2745196 RepID=UPI001C00FC3A|nr:TetR/AcrR family transcriptional regulator [Amycolatopsis sp. CA-230715]QWF85038.1 hypothetical protein HUW46_08491 [Amycolatopsis sp. CA-230715]
MTEPKPLRADARRNRERVLSAAAEVFSEHGTGASTEQVAKAAGVGVGTVFRHFPTKEALLESVLRQLVREFADEAASLADAENPGAAFYELLRRWITMAAKKNAYSDALAAAGAPAPRPELKTGLGVRGGLRTLLERAQSAGAVRADIGLGELLPVIVGASRAVDQVPEGALRERVVEVLLDGLRPGRRAPEGAPAASA